MHRCYWQQVGRASPLASQAVNAHVLNTQKEVEAEAEEQALRRRRRRNQIRGRIRSTRRKNESHQPIRPCLTSLTALIPSQLVSKRSEGLKPEIRPTMTHTDTHQEQSSIVRQPSSEQPQRARALRNPYRTDQHSKPTSAGAQKTPHAFPRRSITTRARHKHANQPRYVCSYANVPPFLSTPNETLPPCSAGPKAVDRTRPNPYHNPSQSGFHGQPRRQKSPETFPTHVCKAYYCQPTNRRDEKYPQAQVPGYSDLQRKNHHDGGRVPLFKEPRLFAHKKKKLADGKETNTCS